MIKRRRWEPNIRGRWFFSLALTILAAGGLTAQVRDGAIGPLLEGIAQYRQQNYAAAVAALRPLPGKAAPLSDYAGFFLGLALYEQKQYTAAFEALQITYKHPVLSPHAGRAALTAAAALTEMGRAREAIAVIKQYRQRMAPAEAEAALARAFTAAGDPVSAAVSWQRVYYGSPQHELANDAATALAGLRTELGDRYPPVMADLLLGRAKQLAAARRWAEARKQLESAIPLLGGADRDLARVRLANLDSQSRQYATAYSALSNLQVSGEADAERLYHLVATARRLDRDDDMLGWLGQLDRKHPQSPWRLEALVTAAYPFLARNEQTRFEPIYRVCAESFPDKDQASFCDWKNVWVRYLADPKSGDSLFREHLRRFPNSEKVPASLYFLGRLAEQRRDWAAAKAYYTVAGFNYPNHYYGVMSAERKQERSIAQAAESPETKAFLDSAALPVKRQTLVFEASPLTRTRLDRARLLAPIPDLAETELRFAARNDGQGHIIAVELARMLDRRGAHDEALRAIKGYVPNYLMIPWDTAPLSFWRVAFPMPYREPLERYARQKSLDPYVVAGLIRQESEFNPKAVSVANAYGLTQVLPSTGRYLSRKNGIRRFAPGMLFEPDFNLRLGTIYLRQLLDSFDSKWVETLASYNAGPTRVKRWLNWGTFREPAELIETIPIAETRDYVQIVLRNAVLYRRLYGTERAGVPSNHVPGLHPAGAAAGGQR